MSSFKKNDVKNHLSAPGRAVSGTFLAASELDAKGFSLAEIAALKNDPTGFVQDFIGEHVGHGMKIGPAEPRCYEN
ncbi:MAG: hypothetical protein WA802_12455 [Terracidiphilus sp.]|jgi:hypothetical protein